MRQAFVSKGDEMHVICLDILFQSSDPEFIFTDQLAGRIRIYQNKWQNGIELQKDLKVKPEKNGLE